MIEYINKEGKKFKDCTKRVQKQLNALVGKGIIEAYYDSQQSFDKRGCADKNALHNNSVYRAPITKPVKKSAPVKTVKDLEAIICEKDKDYHILSVKHDKLLEDIHYSLSIFFPNADLNTDKNDCRDMVTRVSTRLMYALERLECPINADSDTIVKATDKVKKSNTDEYKDKYILLLESYNKMLEDKINRVTPVPYPAFQPYPSYSSGTCNAKQAGTDE